MDGVVHERVNGVYVRAALIVPGDVYRDLSPNRRRHPCTTTRLRNDWKDRVRLFWGQAAYPQFFVPVNVTITLRRGRSVDADNAISALQPVVNALKGERRRKDGHDFIYEPGMIVDDSPKWVKSLTLKQETGRCWLGAEEVLIEVEAADG